MLDPALLRPGRFDRRVVIDNPDVRGRQAILEIHARGKPLAPDVGLDRLAKQTPGFSGADLNNLLNEAAILAARRDKQAVTMAELEEAIDRVILGPERKGRVINDQERRLKAYHEVGHALVAKMLPEEDTVYKLTIVRARDCGWLHLTAPRRGSDSHEPRTSRGTVGFLVGWSHRRGGGLWGSDHRRHR